MPDTNATPQKADVFGDTITEGKPINGEMITISLTKTYAVKLGKSVAKVKCESVADTVKNKESLSFLKTLHNTGISYKDLELSDDVATFLDTYL